MIDKIIYKLFGYLDLFADYMDKVMFPKPIKKTKKKRPRRGAFPLIGRVILAG